MIHPAFPIALLALAPLLAAAPVSAEDVLLAQLTVHERIVVRVQKIAPVAAPKAIVWKERKGPKCVSPGDLAGVLINRPGSVDMVMYTGINGGKWLRAKLDGQCRTLNFYSGIYLKPGADGRVCADRDVIRARSGATCGIAAFKMLEPKR
ncbi:hypothetical protein [Sphingomonas sp.]|uniref:hypothetical protein n=1 Tax=Sphingomonas sp. TaxID=28214 RepID=UPI0035BBC123